MASKCLGHAREFTRAMAASGIEAMFSMLFLRNPVHAFRRDEKKHDGPSMDQTDTLPQ